MKMGKFRKKTIKEERKPITTMKEEEMKTILMTENLELEEEEVK